MPVELRARPKNSAGWFKWAIPTKYLVGVIATVGLIAGLAVLIDYALEKPPTPYKFDAHLAKEWRAYPIRPTSGKWKSYLPAQIKFETQTPGVKACLVRFGKLAEPDPAEQMENGQRASNALHQGVIDKQLVWTLDPTPVTISSGEYILIMSSMKDTEWKHVHVTVSYGRD